MGSAGSSGKASGRGVRWFGLFFLIPGLVVILAGPGYTFYQHLNMSGWVRVPAVLERVELESHQGSDSTTYSVQADYHYDYDGRSYQGHRVGYDWGSDNLSDYHRDLVQRLEWAQARGQVRVWVNPDRPEEGLLVRELRWPRLGFMTLLGGLFSVAGLFIFYFAGAQTPAAALALGEPVYAQERHGHWLWGFMAVMFTGLSLPGVLAIPAELARGNWLILVVLLFPLLGLWFARMGWKSWRSLRIYGLAPLRPDPLPGQAGGDVGGHITLARRLPADDWQVTLQCLQVRVSRGKNSRRHESLLWQQEQVPEVRHDGSRTEVLFRFSPPAELPASHSKGPRQVLWRLLLTGPGVDASFMRTYELPVVQGSARSSVPISESHIRREKQRSRIRSAQAAAGQIEVRSSGQGVELISRAGRNMTMTVMVLLMGLIFAGISIGLWFWAGQEGATRYLMAPAFGLFGFPLTLGGVFMAGRSLHTRIEGTQVRALRCWAGRPLWQRRGELTRADQLVLTSGGSMTQGHRIVEYLSLEVKTGKRRLRLAEGIAGRPVAEALRDNLITLLRLR